MIRYWFEFDFKNYSAIPFGMKMGCGVTAYNYEDALRLINDKVFNNGSVPPIEKFIENIDITTLDKGHILPNMGLPNVRGIWFPLGFN